MYPVSTAYKTQINKSLRNPSFIRVFLGVVEPDAVDGNTMTSTGEVYFSALNDIDNGFSVTKRYHTFEHNRMILDGENLLPPEVGQPHPYYQGYVGNVMSDWEGYFDVDPNITITFNDYFALLGLTFLFDKVLGSYPSEMQVIGYNDDVVVFDKIKYPTDTQYVMEDPLPATGFVNKIELIFKRTFPPKRRIAIDNLTFGVTKEFTDSVITNAVWTREVDLLSSKLPIDSLEFTSIDVEKIYDPENPQGIWKYIEKRQPTLFEIGYQLDDDSIEWVTCGNLYTDGDIKVSSDGKISTATFSFKSYVNQLTDVYYRGIYDNVSNGGLGKSYYELAQDVFDFAGITNYSIDTALQTMYTVLPIPDIPINEALQLIANATRSVCYTNRYGVPTIKRLPNPDTLQDFKFDFSNMKTVPKVTKIPLLYSVDTFYSTVLAENTQSDLVSTDVSATVPTTIRITHDEAQNTNLSTTGITVISSEFYAKSTLVTFTGTGTITVKGKKLHRTKTSVLKVYSDIGYNCPIENPLIDKRDDAVDYANWVASVLLRRNSYESQDRGYPELDILDSILIDTLFSTDLEATVFASKIEYNGSISGTTKYLSKEEI